MRKSKIKIQTTLFLLVAIITANSASAQSTAFTYQGRLEEGGVPASGDYAFVARLFDDIATGLQIGPTFCEDGVEVVNGLFTLTLDFDNQFNSGERFLDIQVLPEGDCADTSGFSQLSPRQSITATPLAVHAIESEVAGSASFANVATAARRLAAPDGSPATAVFVDNNGNVGIGTQTTTSILNVLGGENDGVTATLRLTGSNLAQTMLLDGNEIDALGDGLFLNHNTTRNVHLVTGGGNVGIGTGFPATKLDVQGTMQITSAGDQADLLWLASERSWVFRQDGVGSAAALKLESIGGGGNKNFIIKTTGGVGIGRSPALNKLEVEGSASKTSAGSWLANSDTAIKTNVRTISNALDVIAKLRPVAFRYTEQYQSKHPSVKDQDYYNYIAQEFREVFPEWVHDSGEDGLLQMDEYPAGVYAVAAIQELHAVVRDKTCEVDDLIERERSKDQRLGELEVRNAKLQARVERLEALLETWTSSQQAD